MIAVLNTTLNTRKNYTTVYLQHHLHIRKPPRIHCTYNLKQLYNTRYAPHRVRARQRRAWRGQRALREGVGPLWKRHMNTQLPLPQPDTLVPILPSQSGFTVFFI